MIFKFVILSAEEEDFLREIAIDAESTFQDFHNVIQESVKFDPSQMASFFLSNEEWEKGREITLMEMSEEEDSDRLVMDVTMLREFIKEKRAKLLYIFDFLSERAFFIELLDIIPDKTLKEPVVTKTEGKAPGQIALDAAAFGAFPDAMDEDLGLDSLDEKDNISFENLDDFEGLI